MNKKKTVLFFTLAVIIFISVITSCTKDKIAQNSTHFVSKEFVLAYTSDYIKNLVADLAVTYPDISSLESSIVSGANVYRLIYRTIVNGNEIEASGLVCTPAIPGDYPVICFQNGTNTVDDYAPSRFPANTSYQMVEMVASMGFVVVLPDYPGFGASAQIPHPYLIKEPTVTSIVDMLYAVRELEGSELPGYTIKNEFYLIGYSQGGWATLALHKAMELDFSTDFNLKGSVCGAGPYDLSFLLQSIIGDANYPMPVYIAYIVNSYSDYNEFTNPVIDILNEPYASRLSSLFTGTLDLSEINSQLTTTISDLINSDFRSGFTTASKYSSVRAAIIKNSITSWQTHKPLYFLHGGIDSQVDPVLTDNIYNGMISAGSSQTICKMEIIPGADHANALIPCMIKGFLFIMELRASK